MYLFNNNNIFIDKKKKNEHIKMQKLQLKWQFLLSIQNTR